MSEPYTIVVDGRIEAIVATSGGSVKTNKRGAD
jgi:hypothetical protein